MGAFRQISVRHDGRIRAKSCATFGKIMRHFPQSHRQINPCHCNVSSAKRLLDEIILKWSRWLSEKTDSEAEIPNVYVRIEKKNIAALCLCIENKMFYNIKYIFQFITILSIYNLYRILQMVLWRILIKHIFRTIYKSKYKVLIINP